MAANVIIKTDERRAQEAAMLRHFGGGSRVIPNGKIGSMQRKSMHG